MSYEYSDSYDWEELIDTLNNQVSKISDLKAKLAESEKNNFELMTKLNLKEYKPAFCTLADRDCEALGQVEELKQQLADMEQVKELQDQRIAELEEQLENSIRPKFKIGQEVWYIEDNQVNSATIDDMWIEFNGGIEHYFNLDLSDGFGLVSKTNDENWEPHFGIGTYYVFATKEEAQAKLKELQGE